MTAFSPGKYAWFMGISMLASFSLQAQTHYTLQQLTDASASYLPSLKQKQALADAAKASITDVKHSFLPQVKAGEQLSIGSDNSIAGSYFTMGLLPSTSGGVRGNSVMSGATGNLGIVTGEYELYNFGLNDARLQYAQSVAGLQQADLQKDVYSTQWQVARLFFAILQDQYRLRVDEQNIERYREVFSVIHALTASGLKPGADSSLAKAELSKTKISYNQTLGRINQLKEQLSFYTGIPAVTLQIDTLLNTSVNSKPFLQVFEMDTLNNPYLNYYAKQQQLFTTNEKVISKTYAPKILLAASAWGRGSSIQYNDQYKSLLTGIGYQRFNYVLGIEVTYNLFNGLFKKDKLSINRFQLQASNYEYAQQRAVLQTASLQADNSLRTTQSNLSELPVQLLAAQDTYSQKLAQYKAGIISLVDLTNASFVLYRSQTDYIETLGDWYLAQLDKAASTGNLIQFIQTIK
jgi:outer membrane protein TolC